MSLIAAIKAKNANEVRDSIARGVDVNEIDRDTNYTPLCVAAQTGDVEIVRILLEAGATLDSNYGSPLEEACWNGHLKVIREITRFYPYSEDLHKIYAETLISATIRGHVEIVRCLANAGVDLNAILDDDGTALHYAVDRGQIKVVHTLIDLDVDVNTANDEGETPLAKVLDKRLIESLQFWTNLTTLLIEAGADVNAADNAGKTPLMKVARHNREDISQQLLQAGAVVNACDKQGKTALIVASESGSSAVTKCLIEAGADVNLPDRDGNTALTYVESALLETPKVEDEETDDEFFCKSDRFHNKLEQQKRARQQRIAKYLREGDAIDCQRELMLVKAVKDGKLGEVEALIDTGTPVDRIVPQYGTALLQAVQNGHREIVETLLEEGADPNLVFENRYHGIPLIEAAENGFLDIVRLLLDAGANPHITDADDEEYEGRTAVDRAQMKGHWEIVQLLRERGGPRQTRLPIAEQRGLVSEYLGFAEKVIKSRGWKMRKKLSSSKHNSGLT
ncbi:MAG: ankyrin repeat domain-containing protein [Cyanobacteria bacterium SID2]|nr:ankyrin repeat domain-containing protein [Cyanobacteria bacterium SID2]